VPRERQGRHEPRRLRWAFQFLIVLSASGLVREERDIGRDSVRILP